MFKTNTVKLETRNSLMIFKAGGFEVAQVRHYTWPLTMKFITKA